jgi:hypothetical protein
MSDEASEHAEKTPVSRVAFLLVFIAKFLIFYGALYLTLTKFNKIPFNFLESLVVYFGLLAILWKRK